MSIRTSAITSNVVTTEKQQVGIKGQQVELRLFENKLYVVKKNSTEDDSSATYGLIGADVVFDSMPVSFYEKKYGPSGSATVAEAIQTILTFDVPPENWTPEMTAAVEKAAQDYNQMLGLGYIVQFLGMTAVEQQAVAASL